MADAVLEAVDVVNPDDRNPRTSSAPVTVVLNVSVA
jgi:hypothetical protein